MIEYYVCLKRQNEHKWPQINIYCNEDREEAIREMGEYVRKNGFTVDAPKGRFTVTDVVLVAKEPIAGAQVLSVTPYTDLFDEYGNRRDTASDDQSGKSYIMQDEVGQLHWAHSGEQTEPSE